MGNAYFTWDIIFIDAKNLKIACQIHDKAKELKRKPWQSLKGYQTPTLHTELMAAHHPYPNTTDCVNKKKQSSHCDDH